LISQTAAAEKGCSLKASLGIADAPLPDRTDALTRSVIACRLDEDEVSHHIIFARRRNRRPLLLLALLAALF
jgi:hypothetical protein